MTRDVRSKLPLQMEELKRENMRMNKGNVKDDKDAVRGNLINLKRVSVLMNCSTVTERYLF